ncbi:MAG TPA: hypothetical protein PKO22_00125 [Treponemataceae bacterium]|nr:hypothetical protein [Treponemataceae bacterium]
MNEKSKFIGKRVVALAIVLASACALASAKPKDPFEGLWPEAQTAKEYPASKTLKATPLVAGQYVITGTTVKGKKDSVSKSLIVGKEGNGWIFEAVGIDKKGKKSVMQMLLVGFDAAMKTGDASGIAIGWIKMLGDDGQVQTIEGDQLAFFNAIVKPMYEKMIVNTDAYVDGGPVTVPAGNFAGTVKIHSTAKIMGMKIESDSWLSNAVPMGGMVKSTDGQNVTELLSFGTDGKSELPK